MAMEDKPGINPIQQKEDAPASQIEAESPIGIFINDLARMFPDQAAELTAATLEVLEKIPGELKGRPMWAYFYNEVGHRAKEFSKQASAELYGRAYDNESPYRENTNKPIYANNFIGVFHEAIVENKEPSEDIQEWIAERKSTALEAAECLKHFKERTLLLEGWRQAPKNEENKGELAVMSPNTYGIIQGMNQAINNATHLIDAHLQNVSD